MSVYFPRTIMEFAGHFSTEDACRDYLRQLRWPSGFECPRCGMPSRNYLEHRNLWVCTLGHQTSITTGTIMQRSHVPLTSWFWAAFLQVTNSTGISSVTLAREIGVKQETAYMMLQRLRAGMVDPDREPLSGEVYVDEAFISAGRVRVTRKRGRGTGKPIVVAAVEAQGKYAGRLRMRRIPSANEEDLIGFIQENVYEGSAVVTDGWQAYNALPDYGYYHDTIESEEMHHPHRVFSNLKAWLIGTHHGVSTKHLQAYLNEFTFRYNARRNLMAAFAAVLGIGTHVEGPEYEELYSAGEPDGWIHPNPMDEGGQG